MKYILLSLVVCGVIANVAFAIMRTMKAKKKPSAPKSGYVAQVMCGGTDNVAPRRYEYDGIIDCAAAAKLYGGPKGCDYGCVGQGNCVAACKKGAIHIIGGVAAVDRNKCDACGICVEVCPRGIIELIPADKKYWIGCKSCGSPEATQAHCNIGCIACGGCVRICQKSAVGIVDGHAVINYDLCTNCGECVASCQRKTIWEI